MTSLFNSREKKKVLKRKGKKEKKIRILNPEILFALSFKRKYGHVTQRKK